jgi:hypothetical protein
MKYKCTVTYFITDADGGSLKGRKLLAEQRPWLFVPSCWAHQVCSLLNSILQMLTFMHDQFQLILGDYFKAYDYAQKIAAEVMDIISWINNHEMVWNVFDKAQIKLGRPKALAYLMACITRWTTHFTAFAQLLELKKLLTKTAEWK